MASTASVLSLGMLILSNLCSAQVASGSPEKSWGETRLGIGHTRFREDLEHNKPELILQEVLDTNILSRLAASVGLGTTDLASVKLARDKNGDAVLQQVYRAVDRPYLKLGPRLKRYVEDREDGHTKECLLSALTNRLALPAITDPDLRIMAAQEPLLPVSWWKKEGDVAPKKGTAGREVVFVHIDGDIAWKYRLGYGRNGQHDFLRGFGEKWDAKEYDPKYRAMILQVMGEVEQELKKQGSHREREFSREVEERLRAKGIMWRSPDSFRQHRYQ